MVTVIGTAHISRESVEEVKQKIRERRPEVVCVELCETRYKALVMGANMEILELARAKNVFLLLANVLLSFIQRKLGAEVGMKPGEEMLAAIDAAREVGARVELVDRDIKVTMARAMRGTSFVEKLRVAWDMISAFAASGSDVEKELDELKKDSNLVELMKEFQRKSPKLYEILVEERDAYMARRILDLGSGEVVAVVGAGHKKGLENYIVRPETIPKMDELLSVPKEGFSAIKILKYGLPATVLALFALAFYRGIPLGQSLLLWALNHAVPTFFAVLLAGGSPAAVAAGTLASPITALHPLLAAGWFAGLAEMKMRKVTVGDFSGLLHASGFRELYGNNAFRVLLVTAFANIGSTIGTFISFPTIVLPLIKSLIG